MTLVSHFPSKKDLERPSVPPITDCLVLEDYLGQQIEEIKGELEGIRSYVWLEEANYDEAEVNCLAAVDAFKRGQDIETTYFIAAAEDAYNKDRALRASVEHETPKPLRRKDIPETITKQSGVRWGPMQEHLPEETYQLRVRKFKWADTVPGWASRKAAEVMIKNPPDGFWIAEYERPAPERRYTYDPIIYATYGLWHVEVARWD
jgi:hypothetical protein